MVHDASDPSVRNLGVDSLPAIVGWLSNGEKYILKSGISVKDLKSSIQELSGLLENFEKKYKKTASAKKDDSHEVEKYLPLLTASNFNDICGEKTPVCIIGAFKSSKTRDKIQTILISVSEISLWRRRRVPCGSIEPVSYALVDVSKHESFLKAFEKSGFKSSDNFLLAYKPKRGTFATFEGEITEEAVEMFISSILDGSIKFNKTKHKPKMK